MEKVVSGFCHMFCKLAGKFFPYFMYTFYFFEYHDNVEGRAGVCLYGKKRLQELSHSENIFYIHILFVCELDSHEGFKHLKWDLGFHVQTTVLWHPTWLLSKRDLKNLFSWERELKALLLTRGLFIIFIIFIFPGF